MEIAAKKLRDGWSLVDDAAGASSLMRAKAMLQNQALRFYGTEKEEEAPPAHFDLSLFMLPSFEGIRRVDEVEAEKKAKEQLNPPVELV